MRWRILLYWCVCLIAFAPLLILYRILAACKFKAAGETCRPIAGDCDIAETCSGSSGQWSVSFFFFCVALIHHVTHTLNSPTDTFKANGFVCRAKNGQCDKQETCSGSAAACPADTFLPSSVVCRDATAPCDAAEFCTGTSGVCPSDAVAPATQVCRPSAGICDVAESCDGASKQCPTNAKKVR